MSVTTARRLTGAAWLPWQQRCMCASTSSKAPPPPPPPHTRKYPKLRANPPPGIIRPYKPTSRKPATNPSPSSDPHNPEKETLQTLWTRSWLSLTGAGLIAGLLGFYIVGTITASLKDPCPCGSPSGHEHDTSPTGRPPALTGENAEQFDRELDFPEWWMGIKKLRKRLAECAHGNVLEVAIGTGRNLEYYQWDGLNGRQNKARIQDKSKGKGNHGITSFTGLDMSVDMLDVARKRLVKTVPELDGCEPVVKKPTMADQTGGQLAFLNDQIRLVRSDVHTALPPPVVAGAADAVAATKSPAATRAANAVAVPEYYDTILQTFGLCSVVDPVAVLCNLASAVKPNTGRIILLEHGRGWFGLVNGLLDRNARKHFDKYGCWWNRDIDALVEEAVRKTPGLEIVKMEKPNWSQMGTLAWVELRVTKQNGKNV
ncbi:hypothetical protein E4U57_003241 [Claviceps arundinis]|uniref:Ubiquinone/menaquinone biosynthesis-related protein n=1 Tax=Claviceps arundinis TaxID=1623583 RepID=A0ABQ7P764_9HYPO|nr:hypothetical protein E4U57_003241 [Claviceps arundinis]